MRNNQLLCKVKFGSSTNDLFSITLIHTHLQIQKRRVPVYYKVDGVVMGRVLRRLRVNIIKFILSWRWDAVLFTLEIVSAVLRVGATAYIIYMVFMHIVTSSVYAFYVLIDMCKCDVFECPDVYSVFV